MGTGPRPQRQQIPEEKLVSQKRLKGKTGGFARPRKVVNRATGAFRQAASTLLRSQRYLGARYRRLRTRLGAPKAVTAMARQPACLYYRLIKHEARYREQQIRAIVKKEPKAWPSNGYSAICLMQQKRFLERGRRRLGAWPRLTHHAAPPAVSDPEYDNWPAIPPRRPRAR